MAGCRGRRAPRPPRSRACRPWSSPVRSTFCASAWPGPRAVRRSCCRAATAPRPSPARRPSRSAIGVKTILQMAVVLTYGASMPIVKMGRMAGQFAEAALERHRDARRRDPARVPRRHRQRLRLHPGVARRPTRAGLVQGYHTAASTLNLIRAFTQGGFADLRAGALPGTRASPRTRPTTATRSSPARSTAPSSSWRRRAPTSTSSSASSSTPATRVCSWTTSAR